MDILISAGTQEFSAYEHAGRYFINPGSATGCYSSEDQGEEGMASFVLLDIHGNKVVLYVYKLAPGGGGLKVDKREWVCHRHQGIQ